MKKFRIRMKNKIFPILLSLIIVISIYLLLRFAALSFSDEIGQADHDFADTMASAICSNVMESGSSFIHYSMNDEEEAFAFPLSLVADEFPLEQFAKKNSIPTVRAQENSSLSAVNDENIDIFSEETKKPGETVMTEEEGSFGFENVVGDVLSREYVLTNGALFNEKFINNTASGELNADGELDIGFINGEISYREIEDDRTSESLDSTLETINSDSSFEYTMDQLKDVPFLVRHFYSVHPDTKVTEKLFDAEKLLAKDMRMKQTNDKPQILIYHTHSKEAYADSRPGKASDTVVGMGSYLTQLLEERYGYNVIHDTTSYDLKDEDYLKCYDRAEIGLNKILDENPTIEIVIDLHRDSGENRTVLIEGEETAKIMLFNGLSRDLEGPIIGLDNPNLQDNLAFSFQLQLKALDIYPGLFNKTYLRGYRYNMHVRPKCLLVELGTWKNTVQAAKNALDPFVVVLNSVLQGENNGVMQ